MSKKKSCAFDNLIMIGHNIFYIYYIIGQLTLVYIIYHICIYATFSRQQDSTDGQFFIVV